MTTYRKNKPWSQKKLHEATKDWNERYPNEGVPVIVTRDDGSEFHTITESAACILGGHSAVIFVKGISGAYLLSRVRAKPETGGLPGPQGDY